MTKIRTAYRCSECGADAPRWAGQCSTCQAWNSIEVHTAIPSVGAHAARTTGNVAQRLTEVETVAAAAIPTGIDELDRVLGGGLVPGSVTLLGGEPGVGKSTLLLQLAAASGRKVLYASAEESAQQVKGRAERLGALNPSTWLLAETSLGAILQSVEQVNPHILIVDSIQTIADTELGSAPGSLVQVRDCAHRLVAEAKQRGLTVVLVGHVTKDGGLAGPRVLEHVVDTVLTFDGDAHHALRLLRATKHRFGSTNELGLFDMGPAGLQSLSDPSRLFLADRRTGVSGSAVVATMDGQRPLLVEVQSLVVGSPLIQPRRSTQGFDTSRLNLLLAVLERRTDFRFSKSDVYLSASGGVRLAEPGADLAVCIAAASASVDRCINEQVVFIGEIGLGGELRQVPHTPRRLAEAARLGFTQAVVPPSAPDCDGIASLRCHTLADAIDIVLPKRRALSASA